MRIAIRTVVSEVKMLLLESADESVDDILLYSPSLIYIRSVQDDSNLLLARILFPTPALDFAYIRLTA